MLPETGWEVLYTAPILSGADSASRITRRTFHRKPKAGRAVEVRWSGRPYGRGEVLTAHLEGRMGENLLHKEERVSTPLRKVELQPPVLPIRVQV